MLQTCFSLIDLFLTLHFLYLISHFTHLHITDHILMSYSILVIYPCLYMFHTYNLHRHMQSYTSLSYHGSFKVIYISCTYLISMNKYCYHDGLCNIYTIITVICIRSHIFSFILRFSYFYIIHIFLYFYHACIYSFLYSYMLIICVHVLIPGNILYLINLYLHVL